EQTRQSQAELAVLQGIGGVATGVDHVLICEETGARSPEVDHREGGYLKETSDLNGLTGLVEEIVLAVGPRSGRGQRPGGPGIGNVGYTSDSLKVPGDPEGFKFVVCGFQIVGKNPVELDHANVLAQVIGGFEGNKAVIRSIHGIRHFRPRESIGLRPDYLLLADSCRKGVGEVQLGIVFVQVVAKIGLLESALCIRIPVVVGISAAAILDASKGVVPGTIHGEEIRVLQEQGIDPACELVIPYDVIVRMEPQQLTHFVEVPVVEVKAAPGR